MRSGGQLLMDCLVALGAQKGFGVPGESYLALLDAMYDRRTNFDFIMTRQEGGAAYMAAAWGKLTASRACVLLPVVLARRMPQLAYIRRCRIAADAAVHRAGRR